jgi:glutamate-1-semialdehyde 2,1-aminomutase
VPCIVNDDVEMCLNLEADGVHLGVNDDNIAEVRHILGEDAIIGSSCYNQLSRAKQAQKEGASYVAFGAMFPTPTKPNAPRAALALLKEAKRELEMAELLVKLVPSIEQVRLVSSGTEATMSAIRVARGFTKRDTLVKFEGCYHGHADALLVKAGSGLLTFGEPSSAGVPEDVAKHTLTLPYNDVEALKTLFKEKGDTIATVIIEPVVGNMNLIIPHMEFLKTLRELCTKHGAVLIFDEVMTGFRVNIGGAQALYGITPDLTTLGKVIGGGLPVGAFGGRRDIMQCLAPIGAVYQAGTLSGNPVAVAAGLATLKLVQAPNFFEDLTKKTKSLVDGLTKAAHDLDVKFSAQSVGGMFGIYFSEEAPTSFDEIMKSNKEHFNQFFHHMLTSGFYFGPSAFEAGFVSIAHTDQDIHQTVEAAKEVFQVLK